MPDILETSREGRVLRVALNRPEKRNALNAELCRVLVETLENAFAAPEIGAILLCGNGRHFCAGLDLSEVSAATADSISDAQELLFRVAGGEAHYRGGRGRIPRRRNGPGGQLPYRCGPP